MSRKRQSGGRRFPVSLRVTENLRDKLGAAAHESGRSLAQEVEWRLERSLQEEAILGSPELARMTFMLAANFALEVQEDDWRADPAAYARGANAIVRELMRRAPNKLAIEAIRSQIATLRAQEEAA